MINNNMLFSYLIKKTIDKISSLSKMTQMEADHNEENYIVNYFYNALFTY